MYARSKEELQGKTGQELADYQVRIQTSPTRGLVLVSVNDIFREAEVMNG